MGRTDQVLAALLTVFKGAKPVVGGQGRHRNGLDALTHTNGLHVLCCAQRLLSTQVHNLTCCMRLVNFTCCA